MHQVRRGEHAGAVTCLLQDAFQHGAGGTFAVGTGHSEHRAVKAQLHALRHGTNAIQPQFDAIDALGMHLLAVGQPVGQGCQVFHGRRLSPTWENPPP